MPDWAAWMLVAYVAVSIGGAVVVAALHRARTGTGRLVGDDPHDVPQAPLERVNPRFGVADARGVADRHRVLVAASEDGLRDTLRTALSPWFDVEEAATLDEAAVSLREAVPALVLVASELSDGSGIAFCARLKASPPAGSPAVVLLVGDEDVDDPPADAVLRQPFSPIDLVRLVGRMEARRDEHGGDRLLHLERARREISEQAYRRALATVVDAIEAGGTTPSGHAERVQRLAIALTSFVDASLLDDPSLELGYLLHDVGMLAVPRAVLVKSGPLSVDERAAMQSHPAAGEAMLTELDLLRGAGLRVVRSHHERWDGQGYPDQLAGDEIPLCARIFAVADALDALSHDRSYRTSRSWDAAVAEIMSESGRQFDPAVVSAFTATGPELLRIVEHALPAR